MAVACFGLRAHQHTRCLRQPKQILLTFLLRLPTTRMRVPASADGARTRLISNGRAWSPSKNPRKKFFGRAACPRDGELSKQSLLLNELLEEVLRLVRADLTWREVTAIWLRSCRPPPGTGCNFSNSPSISFSTPPTPWQPKPPTRTGFISRRHGIRTWSNTTCRSDCLNVQMFV